jgi:hypothetical protein
MVTLIGFTQGYPWRCYRYRRGRGGGTVGFLFFSPRRVNFFSFTVVVRQGSVFNDDEHPWFRAIFELAREYLLNNVHLH